LSANPRPEFQTSAPSPPPDRTRPEDVELGHKVPVARPIDLLSYCAPEGAIELLLALVRAQRGSTGHKERAVTFVFDDGEWTGLGAMVRKPRRQTLTRRRRGVSSR
jgi:hypothetical protein